MTREDKSNATRDEQRPMNNVEGGDGDVHFQQSRRGRVWTAGPTVVLLITLGVILTILLVGLVVGLVVKRTCRQQGVGPVVSAPVLTDPKTVPPRPTIDPVLPWSNIRLPRNIIPSVYTVELKIDLEHFNFSGSVSINVSVRKDTEYVIVHINDLNVSHSRVTVDDVASGEAVSIVRQLDQPTNQFHVLQMSPVLRSGKDYTIHFGYFRGQLGDGLRGLYRSMYKDQQGETRYLAVSQLQSVDARRVFPCFDEPDLKANFSVTITHYADLVALSNMPLARSTSLDDTWVRDEFEMTPIMSTYLLAFVVADFRHRESSPRDGFKIRIWAQPDMYDQTSYALGFAAKAYQFYSNFFGTPEIVPKADHAAIPDFSAGAMENWGLVLYRETALLHDEDVSSIANTYWVSLVMAHEIAHTWFGNMVTMRWWDDLWLNEGFANTLMYFALDSIYPTWNVFDLQLVNNVYPVMTKDSLLTSHAISTPIKDPVEITQTFDTISYDKGMAVLRLLRGFLGWDDFQKGLMRYVQKYKFKNAEMAELWQTFAEVVDNRFNVGDIMDTWTRQMGFPVVRVIRTEGDTYMLTQHRFLLNANDEFDPSSSPYGFKWRIPFSYKIQGDDSVKTEWMDLDSANIRVPKGSWVLGNVDYMGFYRTNYDESTWSLLTEQLISDDTVFSAANRAGLISDAFNLARADQLNYEIALNLSSYLHKETNYVPWRAFLNSIDFIKGMLSTSNAYGMLKKYIFDLVAPQFRRVGTSDQGGLLDRSVRGAMLEAACGVGVPDAVEWAHTTFTAWMKYGTKIPPDYAVVIYAVGIQQGGETEWNYLWEKAQNTRVASEAEIMMNALAYTQEPWLLWRYARWSMDSSKIRMQDVRNLFRYFVSTPLGRSVALQFILTNWEEINKRFGMDAFLLRDIIYATTSLINTEYEYQQLKRLYRISPPAGVASKAADNSLALIRSNIKWMKHNQATIERWLHWYVSLSTTS